MASKPEGHWPLPQPTIRATSEPSPTDDLHLLRRLSSDTQDRPARPPAGYGVVAVEGASLDALNHASGRALFYMCGRVPPGAWQRLALRPPPTTSPNSWHLLVGSSGPTATRSHKYPPWAVHAQCACAMTLVRYRIRRLARQKTQGNGRGSATSMGCAHEVHDRTTLAEAR